jgi:hypothetical protein
VVIGMDPHKRSATIEVMAGDETVFGTGRFDTDRPGFAAMVIYAKQWPNRVWAMLAGTSPAGFSPTARRSSTVWVPKTPSAQVKRRVDTRGGCRRVDRVAGCQGG